VVLNLIIFWFEVFLTSENILLTINIFNVKLRMVLAGNMKETLLVTPQIVFCDEYIYPAIFLDYLLEDNK